MSEPKHNLDTNLLRNYFPLALQVGFRFIGWHFIVRDGEQTKAPVAATATNSKTRTAFDDKLKHFSSHEGRHLDGIGRVFVASDGFVGVDFDDCVDANGQITGLAAEWLPRLNSYSEISPSGTGVKTWVRATLPDNRGRRNATLGVEVYS